ncbi:MAG: transcription termination/antitermination protein NusG [Oscillospiraceae bacterium]|jgi:transcriptional antiterminator NusG|nr:transcription termination/antitermination protein NusG [Oscillospiraceae bacterium]
MAETSQWYILHTYSGYENKVKENIETVAENAKLQDLIQQVEVPEEEVAEEKNGKTKITKYKLFPAYVYVKMVMTDKTWYVCRNTRGVTGFVGPGSKPIPMTDEEVERVLNIKPEPIGAKFRVGDYVEITSGPLDGFDGQIKVVDAEAGTVEVAVSMFGQESRAIIEFAGVRVTNKA